MIVISLQGNIIKKFVRKGAYMYDTYYEDAKLIYSDCESSYMDVNLFY